jgi:hypothetical protein
MKHALYTCLIWFILLPAHCQNTFEKFFNTGYNNVFSCKVTTLTDSGAILLNYIRDSATGRQDFGTLRIDKNGNEQVKMSINYFNYDFNGFLMGMKHFFQVSEASFLLSSIISVNGKYSLALVKINASTLDTIGTKLIADGFHYTAFSNFIRFGANHLMLSGIKSNGPVDYPCLIAMDTNLNIKYSKVFNPIPIVNTNAIYNPVKKKIILGGWRPSGNYSNISLVQIDTNGVMTRSCSSNPNYSVGTSQIFYSAPDSTYIAIGGQESSYYGGHTLTKIGISKYDTELNLIWRKSYGDEALTNALSDAVILDDGSIVACGRYSKKTSLPLLNYNYAGALMKVDRDGNLAWFREYDAQVPTSYMESFHGVARAPDGGFYVCGNVIYQPNAQAWVLKTDSAGCVQPGCAASTITVASLGGDPPGVPMDTATTGLTKVPDSISFSAYPNPFKESLNLTAVAGGDLRILDLTGREAGRAEIHSGRNEIRTKGLAPGVYILEFATGGRKAYRKVVKD